METAAHWGWHRFATDPAGPFAYSSASVPDLSWWMPSVHTYDVRHSCPMGATTYTRWEASDGIAAALKRGRSVEVWDQTPSCLSRLVFAAGPCSPLTCDIGRPLRGAAPRYR